MSDKIYDKSRATLDAWHELATKQMKGRSPDELVWQTAEDIPVKPLYTAADVADLSYTDTMPGMSPYIRGPQATMYTGRPLKNPMRFIARHWRLVARACLWHLIWPPTAVMTPITRGLRGMWAKPVWPLTR